MITSITNPMPNSPKPCAMIDGSGRKLAARSTERLVNNVVITSRI
jgi:hypothetical protein